MDYPRGTMTHPLDLPVGSIVLILATAVVMGLWSMQSLWCGPLFAAATPGGWLCPADWSWGWLGATYAATAVVIYGFRHRIL